MFKNENQIKIVCNINLFYFSIKFAINKICRDEECMMEMMNSCSIVIFFEVPSFKFEFSQGLDTLFDN